MFGGIPRDMQIEWITARANEIAHGREPDSGDALEVLLQPELESRLALRRLGVTPEELIAQLSKVRNVSSREPTWNELIELAHQESPDSRDTGSEHLLLAILREPAGRGGLALEQCGVSASAIREALRRR